MNYTQHTNGLKHTVKPTYAATLVKYMPASDDKKTPPQTHNLTSMIERANTMLLDIEQIDALNTSNNRNVQFTITHIIFSLKKIQLSLQKQHDHTQISIDTLNAMQTHLDSTLIHMGLNTHQKHILLHFVNTGIEKSLAALHADMDINSELNAIQDELSNLSDLLR